MTVAPHHTTALIGAALTSTIALSDAIMHGATGRNLLTTDGSRPAGWIVAGDLVHGLTYVALSWVLIAERDLLGRANRWVRILRHLLLASLVLLAAGFVLIDPIVRLAHLPPGGVAAAVWGGMAGIGFAGMIISCLLLGIAVLRRNPLGYGGRVLGLVVPVLVVTVLLGLAASDWAHPGYVETVIYFGLALIGVGAAPDTTTTAGRRNDTKQLGDHPLGSTPSSSGRTHLSATAPPAKMASPVRAVGSGGLRCLLCHQPDVSDPR
jgi:hypothetical protein